MLRRLIAIVLCVTPAQTFAQDIGLEYRVKAAYLFNFTKFVEWPASAFEEADSFSICVAGRSPFGAALAETLVGQTAAGLPLVSRIVDPDDTEGCHVLFVPRGVAAPPYLRVVGTTPVLTVGESPDFVGQGGTIRFVIEEGRVRFEISQESAARAQLRVSSRLLQLARGKGAPENN